MRRTAKIYIAGHTGLVGSALFKRLLSHGYRNLLYRNHRNLDLRNQDDVNSFFKEYSPDYVFMCAGKVGGIMANSTEQGSFLYDNLIMAANVIEASRVNHVRKLLYLGSSCIYPKDTEIPIKESQFLDGKPEPTNEGYAIAKITGIELCKLYRNQYGCDFISAIPCNLYGERDNFNEFSGHFIPSMISKVFRAKKEGKLTIWGSGEPLREFMHSDDLAEAMMFLMEYYSSGEPINVGAGKSESIWNTTLEICKIVGYDGKIELDRTKPDGQREKTMNISKLIDLGWFPKISLEEGLKKTIKWYEENVN